MQLITRRVGVIAASALLFAVAAIGIGIGVGVSQARPPAPLTAVAVASDLSTDAAGSVTDDDLAAIDAVLAADKTTGADGGSAAARLRRLAAWKHLVHATVVVDLPKVGLTTIQLDHGTVSAVSATSLTITEAGNGSVTVALSGETRVRRAGAKANVAALKVGDAVFAMSKVEAGGTAAYIVVVPRS